MSGVKISMPTDCELVLKAVSLRRRMLRLIHNAGAGHTGGGLSCLDILNVLYNRVLRIEVAVRAANGPVTVGPTRIDGRIVVAAGSHRLHSGDTA